MKNLLLVLAVLLTMFFSSCEVYTTPGPQGPAGVSGPPGNANVQTWFFTIAPYHWSTYGNPGFSDHSKYVILSIPQLNADYVDYGLVMVYLESGGGSYTPLPITAASGATDTWIYNYVSPYQVEVDVQLANLQTPVINTNYGFKVVAVSGYFRKAHPNINWNNYADVQKALLIQ
jgi:hypothetical protein